MNEESLCMRATGVMYMCEGPSENIQHLYLYGSVIRLYNISFFLLAYVGYQKETNNK